MKSIVMALALLQSTVVPADAPLAPSGKWVVEYGQSECVLSRSYGTAPAATIVGLKPAPLGGSLEIAVIKPGVRALYRTGKATLTLLPSQRVIESTYDTYGLRKTGQTVSTVSTDEDVSADLENATSIKLDLGKDGVQFIAIPGVKKALAALETCQVDLLKGWMVDPAEREFYPGSPRATIAKSHPSEWISSADYPGEALQAEQEGSATALWKIAIDGRVKECRIVRSTGNAALDRATCAAFAKRARYTPALDKQGKPMEFHAMRHVIWRLPG